MSNSTDARSVIEFDPRHPVTVFDAEDEQPDPETEAAA